jgi:hypothetical protein
MPSDSNQATSASYLILSSSLFTKNATNAIEDDAKVSSTRDNILNIERQVTFVPPV